MPRTIIRHAMIVSMNAAREVFEGYALVVENGLIQGIEPEELLKEQPDDEIVDARGRLILPGFVNSHVHTVQHLGRGLGNDVDLLTWLHERIWPYESHLNEEESYLSTMLFGLEQIASGCTTAADAGVQHAAAACRAVDELGTRAAFCQSIMDEGEGLPAGWRRTPQECIDYQEELFRRHHGEAGGRVRWWLGLRTIMNNSDELIERTSESASRLGTSIHMHVAEAQAEIDYCRSARGDSTVRHLEKLGALKPNLMAAHVVYVDDEEIELLRERRVGVAHNPAAAMRVLGMPRVVEMRARGVTVGLGTDGAPTNCRNSMVDEMWLASLLQKCRLHDPAAAPAEDVLAMATIDSARCIGWAEEVGSLEVGKKADLIVINPQTANMLPMHDPISNLVHSMKSENVESTMCNGVWLMRERRFTQVDADGIFREVVERAEFIRKRAGIKLPERFRSVKHDRR